MIMSHHSLSGPVRVRKVQPGAGLGRRLRGSTRMPGRREAGARFAKAMFHHSLFAPVLVRMV